MQLFLKLFLGKALSFAFFRYNEDVIESSTSNKTTGCMAVFVVVVPIGLFEHSLEVNFELHFPEQRSFSAISVSLSRLRSRPK